MKNIIAFEKEKVRRSVNKKLEMLRSTKRVVDQALNNAAPKVG